MTESEQIAWEQFRKVRLLSDGEKGRAGRFFARLAQLAETADQNQQYLLEELQLYGQSILPINED